jgi:hypothetical protein
MASSEAPFIPVSGCHESEDLTRGLCAGLAVSVEVGTHSLLRRDQVI